MLNACTKYIRMKHSIDDAKAAERQVMTIINVTEDSFYDGSRTFTSGEIERRAAAAAEQGTDIFDVGGYSSRPGADDVPLEEEWRRVERGIAAVRRVAGDIPVSVDTFRGEVARRAIEKFGGITINDISAGEIDPSIVDVAARYDVPYIAMHMRGTPRTMQTLTGYAGAIVDEVVRYFDARCAFLQERGVKHIILDPGFGFAKDLRQNYELMAGLHRICAMGYPVLVGVSRKSMIYRVTGRTPAESLAGTAALNWEALRQGASILRVHDTREAVDLVRMFSVYEQCCAEGGKEVGK